ncbi:MAG: aspartate aminotransferase family protein [Clostridiales bacterium]|nr:aspartate aminotransferase family protein [Clostridiales bacterium]
MSIENDFYLVKSFDQKYCLQVFAPADVCFTEGKGSYLYSMEDKEHGIKKRKYLDMIGGIAVNSLGHGNKELTGAIAKQAGKLIHCCNYYYIAERSELAFKLCKNSFADKVFFSNSGAEANEAAIKLARGYFYYKQQEKYEIITANMSFHGRTMATISATGQEKFRKPFEPVLPGFKYVDYNDYEQLEGAITDKTAAVMLELIQGESGVHPADRDYIKKVAALCKAKGILLIIDEVQTGVGRTGTLFCYEQYGIKPDIMTLAKGLGGGVPIGATLCTNEVATGFQVGDHGSTFGGNPLACTAGNVVMDQIIEGGLLANVNKSANYLMDELTKLRKKYEMLKSVRGMGLLIALEFDNELISASGMKERLFSMGILVSAIGKSTIRIAPPLTISVAECSEFVKAIETILKSEVETKKPLSGLIDGIKSLTGGKKEN